MGYHFDAYVLSLGTPFARTLKSFQYAQIDVQNSSQLLVIIVFVIFTRIRFCFQHHAGVLVIF